MSGIYKSNSNFGAGCPNWTDWADLRFWFVHSTDIIEQNKSVYHNKDTSKHIWWIGIENLFLKHYLMAKLAASCVNIQKMSSTNFFLVSILQFSTNEFHAGSDTRCDEENDFDAIFGIVLVPSHTHNYAQSFSTIGVGILHSSYHKKRVFRNLQTNPSNVKVKNLRFNFSCASTYNF